MHFSSFIAFPFFLPSSLHSFQFTGGLLNALDEGFRVLGVHSGLHAVAEIRNVALLSKLLHHLVSGFANCIFVCIQNVCIHVSLQCLVREPLSHLLHVCRPAETNAIVAGIVKGRKGHILGESDNESLGTLGLDQIGNHAHILSPKLLVEMGGENSGVSVKHLQHLRPRVPLSDEILGGESGDCLEEFVGLLGVVIQPSLGLCPCTRPLSFHHVPQDRPGCPTEPEDRHFVVHLLLCQVHGIKHVPQRVLNIRRQIQLLDVLRGLQSPVKNRSPVRKHLQGLAHSLGHHEDIREDDARVKFGIPPSGLDCYLRSETRVLAHLEKFRACPDSPEFGQVPSRLSHHPHRDSLDLLSLQGIDHVGVLRQGPVGLHGCSALLPQLCLL
mmetsp:Transcript_11503/g.22166  ORF Transcript_11503/g.22166 Transcript_11503/m.22166 type:complete len:384 (-) Transcript_11503:333-1484(-)